MTMVTIMEKKLENTGGNIWKEFSSTCIDIDLHQKNLHSSNPKLRSDADTAFERC